MNTTTKLSVPYLAVFLFLSLIIFTPTYGGVTDPAKRVLSDSLQSSHLLLKQGESQLNHKAYRKALASFLKAKNLLPATVGEGQQYEVMYGIAQANYFLGFYNESTPLLKSCQTYYLGKDSQIYLHTIYYLALSLEKQGRSIDSSFELMLGFDECNRLGVPEMKYYFFEVEGIINYSAEKYLITIQKLESSSAFFEKKGDFANVALCHFYIGMSYELMGQKEKGIAYYKKIDEIFTRYGYVHPEFRPAYEKLIAQAKKDTKRLYYIEQLQKADLIFKSNYPELFQRIVPLYNAMALQNMRREAEKPGLITFSLLGLFALLLLFCFYRYSKWQKHFIYVSDFSNLLGGDNEQNTRQTTENISPEVEHNILSRLEKFERERLFLEREMTLAKMASLFNTNTRYVALVIVKHRGKGTIEYVNDLKIDLIVQLLRQEEKYRQYSQDALAEEVGFNTRQNFTKAFKERMGVSVGEFVKGLER